METVQVSAQVLNQNFVDLIDQGHIKEAADAGTALIREIVRQDAAVREILPPKSLTADDLDIWPDSDQPVKFMDIEPGSVASFVQFYGTPKSNYYYMRKVPVFFGKMQSDEFVKNKFELMTYRTDVRKLLADNSVKDIADQEDIYFRRECLKAVNRNPTVQRTELPRLTATGWAQALRSVYDRRLSVGKALMSKSRQTDMIDLPATAVGDSIASAHYKEGIDKEDGLWGIPLVTTLKSDIYLPDEAWLFPPENFFGKFWTLQDATLFVEQRADIIKFFVYSAPGIGFGNVKGIQQIAFGPRAAV
jgi:hypothetical protein